MTELHPFSPSLSLPKVSVKGDLELKADGLHLRFEITDPDLLLRQHPTTRQWDESTAVRTDGLWKHCCYEAFWAIPGSDAYFEANFSSDGAWNLYHFDKYRLPQPPTASRDFELLGLNVDVKEQSPLIVRAHLGTKTVLSKIDYSLCAVLETKMHEHFYYSSRHAGQKPDFHLRESLTLTAALGPK